MTLWDFQARYDGWKAANSNEEAPPPAMTDEDAARLGIQGFD